MKNIRPTLLLLDILTMYVALVLAVVLRGTIHGRAVQTLSEWISAHTIIFIPAVIFSLLTMYIAGLYDVRTIYEKSKVVPLIIYSQVGSALLSVLFFYVAHTDLTPKLTLFLYSLLAIALIVLVRSLTLSGITSIRKSQAIYLIDDSDTAHSLERFNQPYSTFLLSQMALSSFLKMSNIQRESFDAVIYDESLTNSTENFIALEKLKQEGLICISNVVYYEDLYKKVDLDTFDHNKFKSIFSDRKENPGHYLFRRTLDIVTACIIMPISILSLPFIFILNILGNRGKMFSVQNRVGELEKIIKIYKLRTMQSADNKNQEQSNQEKLSDAYKYNITKIGAFLRKTRLDEFPQWVNLFVGNISIIGPRADIVGIYYDMSENIDNYRIRSVVPQGITGWAQVHMSKPPRCIDEYKERLAYELYYIKNRSILLDISIILKTIKTMIARTGA